MSIYVASRASIPEYSAMWRHYRSLGVPIISSWIDEADEGQGEGQTSASGELWARIEGEIARSEALVLYAEEGDFPLKGALIEVGIALGMSKPVIVCLPYVKVDQRSYRPIGSWINHPRVTLNNNIREIMQKFYAEMG